MAATGLCDSVTVWIEFSAVFPPLSVSPLFTSAVNTRWEGVKLGKSPVQVSDGSSDQSQVSCWQYAELFCR